MNWIFETIEREAMNRATRNLALQMTEGGDTVVLMGLTMRQIMFLKNDFESRTGHRASDITTPETGMPLGSSAKP